jgi:hypothetical protein
MYKKSIEILIQYSDLNPKRRNVNVKITWNVKITQECENNAEMSK